jgi:hypothetical protein
MSLFPLGILSAAGAGGVQGDYELIETVILGSAQSSVTFSSLATYASTYKHLQIRAVAQNVEMSLRFNGVTASGSYKDHRLYGLNGTVYSGSDYTNKIFFGTLGQTGDTNQFGATVSDILDPFSTSKNTTIRGLNGRASSENAIVNLFSGVFLSTDSITSIEILQYTGGNLSIGSRFSLYGIRG